MTLTTHSCVTAPVRRKPQNRTLRTLALVTMLATVGLALGGPGSGGVELPSSSISAGGGSHSVVLANGDPFDVDFSVGLTMAAEGTGASDYSLSSGFQAQREAAEQSGGPIFRRGDANQDGVVDLADGIGILIYLFYFTGTQCADAKDANDSGAISITDAVTVLCLLFCPGQTPVPPAPGPDSNCGPDPTDDNLDCEIYNGC